MRKKLLAMIITIPLIFSSCASVVGKNLGKEENFATLLSNINKHNEEILKKDIKLDEKYFGWIERKDDLTKEECEEIFKPLGRYVDGEFKFYTEEERTFAKTINLEQATKDLDMLFKLFRNCYGAYGYFGGDEIFFKAKNEILKELQGKKEINGFDFYKLIYSKLDFLKDKHTNYGAQDKNSKGYYMCKNNSFFKDEKGYYKINDKKQYYISEINNDKDISKFMKRTIDKDGKLVYTIAILSESYISNKDQALLGINIEVNYLGGKDKISEKINLKAVKSGSDYATENSYSNSKGVPILKFGRMYNKLSEDKEEREIVDSAEELKECAVSIIDLRGNGGGFLNVGEAWFQKYTGSNYVGKRINLNFNSNLVRTYKEKLYKISCSDGLFVTESLGVEKNNRIKNKNTIFILVDDHDLSAAEVFIENMKCVDNVVLVGTNTGGTMLTSDIYTYVLKNSKIPIMLGSTLHVTPYFEEFEYKGFEPDILVDSNNSLEQVLKLIDHYKLNEKK